ncbi:MAG: YdcF family protein [Campylobacterales bacterium]|nr:YdcF family protein [Campylobacterales bacterium]
MELGFLLKKVLSAVLMPFSLGLLILLIGLFFLFKNSYKKAKVFLVFGFIWIVLISYVPVSNFLIAPLENSYKKLDLKVIPKDTKYILLLGGDRENRGWEALRIYNYLPNAKIITSGYAGRGTVPEAIKTAKVFESIGIPKKDIIIHSKPKDTKEEAIKIKEILGSSKFILVTSAYHMPRAMALFQKEGLEPIAAPTDFQIKDSNKALSVPQGNNLKKTEQAWHEYLGLLWSKLRGQI